MDLGMRFNVGGQQGEEMDAETRAKVEQFVSSRIGGLRCPDHDRAPVVMVSGTRLDDLRFEVKGCCDGLVELVQQKLSE